MPRQAVDTSAVPAFRSSHAASGCSFDEDEQDLEATSSMIENGSFGLRGGRLSNPYAIQWRGCHLKEVECNRALTAPIPTRRVNPEVARRTANFRPCFWGDRFLTYTPDDPVNVLS
uniref:Uncharacterized protein n=1 Tax=Vitis vinifera TaxID=29760 RepID=A5B337_VITVI|nr:hypothetical protein VITISV_002707 [Vitis vinifera]